METARLTKDGRLLDPGGNPANDPLPLLGLALRLDADCTLRSFFSLLVRHPDLRKLSQFLPAALADAGKCPASGCRTDDIPILVLGKTMELIGFPGEARAELYVWLRGLDAQAAQSALSAFSPGASAAEAAGTAVSALPFLLEADREIRFIPLQVLLDTPLLLAGLKHVLLGDVDRRLFCESRFTLFEAIDGLAWELGFQGGNQQCSLGR